MLSIIVPYLSTSPCIEIFKQMIKENTASEYELVEIVDSTDVYDAFNSGVKRANGELVALLNDDMFVGKDWDVNYVKYTKEKTVCTGYLVEPGVIPVSSRNIHKDFGRSPSSFRKEEFLKWSDEKRETLPEVIDGMGWFMPLVMEKKHWIDYPNEKKHPHPNDIELLEKILPSMGYKYLKVNSVVYHLQAFTTQSHLKRE